MADDRPAYQLERLALTADLIRRTVQKRVEAKRHSVDVNWREALDDFLNKNNAKQSCLTR
jgi:hypothetical protein